MESKELYEIIGKLNEILTQLMQRIEMNCQEDKNGSSHRTHNHKWSSLSEEHTEYLNLLNERRKEMNERQFISSGFAQMDELIGGFYEGELTVIGGRPGIGKTSLILSMIQSQLKNQLPVAIYSLELTKEAIIDRLISIREKIPISQLRTGKLTYKEFEKIEKGLIELTKHNLYFIEGSFFSPNDFSDEISSMITEKGIRIIFIDYLQLMISSHPRRNREQEISQLMRTLKSVALEFRIPVIITSQMNRYVEYRGGTKRPLLSDLRESGSIEEIADKVIFIYRAEAYGIPVDEEGNSTIGKAELIVAKNRLGPAGDIILHYDKNLGLFENISWDKKVFPSLNLPDNPFNEGQF